MVPAVAVATFQQDTPFHLRPTCPSCPSLSFLLFRLFPFPFPAFALLLSLVSPVFLLCPVFSLPPSLLSLCTALSLLSFPPSLVLPAFLLLDSSYCAYMYRYHSTLSVRNTVPSLVHERVVGPTHILHIAQAGCHAVGLCSPPVHIQCIPLPVNAHLGWLGSTVEGGSKRPR